VEGNMKKIALVVVLFLIVLYVPTLPAKNASFGLLLQKNSQDYFQVKGVVKNSPAYDLGLKPGDIILKVNDNAFTNPLMLRELNEGYKITITVLRNGEKNRCFGGS